MSERVGEQIENLIITGHFQSGEKLPSVRELCELFDVGRSAVRDAITTMKGKGLVDVRHGEGTYVQSYDPAQLFRSNMLLPDMKDIEALFQVRAILETEMVKMAAENRTEKDLREMEKTIRRMRTACHEENETLDYHFHKTIAKAAGNHILYQLMEFISSTTQKAMVDFHGYIAEDEAILSNIINQHEQIFENIKLGDGEGSSKVMHIHLEEVKRLMQKSILNETESCL
ncbi:FadR/GntR family transcriptional regulator [Pseudalkalibacillus caeni]|uniref:FadR/GntR family transcriptional regulator n=1 Tax=Exobacillus caeni TaxID=2574798 RepID=UPI001FE5C959|nr:FadR/GntR family transcriptional regulator [Pseudalkalibacillus caeni]